MSDRVLKLAALQDLELMIREAEDPASKENEEALGFPMQGLEKLEKDRDRLVGQIPKKDLRIFQRIRRRYERVVVPVVSRICLGCFQELPTSRTRSLEEDAALPTCESCGRILYWL
ncbi:C4-type zinc ribbon domain-containing protein [Candidatus Eisenbacteria bacterium]|uniref:C4-type zinc ribbon domain-containing protein n=1 Tax=Eiseniibacteriota bacterium TaxID=2212470 RepID=A0ABV6YKA0_UNCEI